MTDPPAAPPRLDPAALSGLGLGPLFQPAPVVGNFARIGPDAYVLVLDSVMGRFGVLFDGASLRALLKAGEQTVSGLIVAS